jgi:wyosine [tRNA(Phe)-imidazoG37] synthetase (radical SAM superfamily)
LTFVPDGEPTLDAELGREIALLKGLRIPVAVISNGSLIGRGDVREDLLRADWVSLKIDAVEDAVWQRVDRPHGSLQLAEMLEGALRFARAFRGRLVTETMLVAGINDSAEHLREVAGYLARLQPAVAYLAVPTRPPAEAWVRPPDAPALNRAFQLFQEKGSPVEYLIGYEGDAFAFTGDAEADLLSITAVHPMRRDAVVAFLARAGSEWGVVEALLADGRLVQTFYGNHEFYVRRLAGPG